MQLWFHQYSWASFFMDKVKILFSRISQFMTNDPINRKC